MLNSLYQNMFNKFNNYVNKLNWHKAFTIFDASLKVIFLVKQLSILCHISIHMKVTYDDRKPSWIKQITLYIWKMN